MASKTPELPPAKGKPIFIGKSALVRLHNENDPTTSTIWLVDSDNKTLRPFVSEDKFDQMFDNPTQAHNAVVTLPASELSPAGILGDFHVLNGEYGVKTDGSMKNVPYSPSQIQSRYGKPINEEGEDKAVTALDGLVSGLGAEPNQDASMSPPAESEQPPMGMPEGMGGPGDGTVDTDVNGMVYAGKGGPGDNGDRYGKTLDPNAASAAFTGLLNETNIGSTSAQGSLTPNYISSLMNDPMQLAFYINAMAYGGYTMGDIYKDMYRNQQSQTTPSLVNVAFISPSQDRTTYLATPAGQQANTIAQTILPSGDKMQTTNPNMFKYDVYNMPDSALGVGSAGVLEPGSPEWKAAVSDIKTDYFDTLTAMASAQTDQDKAKADYDYNQFISDAETKLGISLSDDASQVWRQIDGLDDMYGKKMYGRRGIQGSGLENEATDELLQQARLQDQRNRQSTLNQEEQKKAATMVASGSSSQIASLTPEQRQAWGLTPSPEIAQKFSVAAIMAANPTYTPEQAQAQHDAVLDENGNYRSTLYSKLYSTKLKNSTDATQYQNDTLLNNMKITNSQASTAGQVVDPLSITQVKKQLNVPNPNNAITTPAGINTTPTTTPVVPASSTPVVKPTTVSAANGPIATSGANQDVQKPAQSGYIVKPGDTLYSIYGDNWKTLSGYQGDPTKLSVGTVLNAKPTSINSNNPSSTYGLTLNAPTTKPIDTSGFSNININKAISSGSLKNPSGSYF